MHTEAQRLREELSICRRSPKFNMYSPAIRREAMRYVRKRSKQGIKPKHLADELGMSQATGTAWLRRAISEERLAQEHETPQTSQAVSF